MATTDTRPGFRLPWNTERADADANGTEPVEGADGAEPAEAGQDAEAEANAEAEVSAEANAEAEVTEAPEAQVESPAEVEGTAEVAPAVEMIGEAEAREAAPTPAPAPAPAVASSGRKPNKFLADLTRAMQATAQSARDETMERFSADAKTAVERVHAAAADETTELRRVADDDVAGIRDWSKAEIARIREETENRISGRKAELERELELHAGTVEGRIERVNSRVTAFQSEVADFYERLFAEEDPTRFAAMAEQLPEPPSLDLPGLDEAVMIGMPERVPVDAVDPVVDEAGPEAAIDMTVEVTPEASPDDDAAAEAEAMAAAEAEGLPADDPRLAAIEAAPDFAAAEAEAASVAEAAAPAEEIATIDDEVLAARLAGLTPDENPGSNPIVTTKVVVTGLVSVASIAGFKRHVGRLQGVTTVGVSSGPDGEFVFSVNHLPTMELGAGLEGLTGFQTKITGQREGTIEVTASDPDAHD